MAFPEGRFKPKAKAAETQRAFLFIPHPNVQRLPLVHPCHAAVNRGLQWLTLDMAAPVIHVKCESLFVTELIRCSHHIPV